jgi:putative phosphoesterase
MRVALISDLHGNEIALNAVLADIARQGADQIVCLGDVATLGPHPTAVLGRLRDLGCACILGNHDEFMFDAELVHTYTKIPVLVDSIGWCRDRLSLEELDFIRTFETTREVELAPGVSLSLFHGTPGSNMTDLLATTSADDVDVMLGGRRAAVMAGGHTHIQMLRQHRGVLIVNPGSVGMPFQEYVGGRAPVVLPHAEYALIQAAAGSISVDLRRVSLDRAALRRAAASVDNPLSPGLAQMYA